MTDEEFYARTANWLREEQGFLVDSVHEIEEDPDYFVVDVYFTFSDEDGYHSDAYEYMGSIDELKAVVAEYED
jgi:hypothetical protein